MRKRCLSKSHIESTYYINKHLQIKHINKDFSSTLNVVVGQRRSIQNVVGSCSEAFKYLYTDHDPVNKDKYPQRWENKHKEGVGLSLAIMNNNAIHTAGVTSDSTNSINVILLLEQSLDLLNALERQLLKLQVEKLWYQV